LTLKALGALSKLDPQAIQRIERGITQTPYSTTLAALAPHLGLELDALLDATKTEDPASAEVAQ
jgi:transcriptional regulator with XRE-family HTH domain